MKKRGLKIRLLSAPSGGMVYLCSNVRCPKSINNTFMQIQSGLGDDPPGLILELLIHCFNRIEIHRGNALLLLV
jgi:hypothetical protein